MPEIRDLLREAFAAAHARGKSDWQTMTTAVLKNRLLVLQTDFSEKNYGASSILEFAQDICREFLTVDTQFLPPRVTLTNAELIREIETRSEPAPEDKPPSATRLRIRHDLWNAMMDYASGRTWVWDAKLGRARLLDEGESTDGLPAFHNMKKDEVDSVRARFIEEQAAGDTTLEEKLRGWQQGGGSIWYLPENLRAKWANALKDTVERRLRDWFDKEGIDPPADLVVALEPKRPAPASTLRAFILRCIDAMTDQELESLQIPATALQRILLG